MSRYQKSRPDLQPLSHFSLFDRQTRFSAECSDFLLGIRCTNGHRFFLGKSKQVLESSPKSFTQQKAGSKDHITKRPGAATSAGAVSLSATAASTGLCHQEDRRTAEVNTKKAKSLKPDSVSVSCAPQGQRLAAISYRKAFHKKNRIDRGQT